MGTRFSSASLLVLLSLIIFLTLFLTACDPLSQRPKPNQRTGSVWICDNPSIVLKVVADRRMIATIQTTEEPIEAIVCFGPANRCGFLQEAQDSEGNLINIPLFEGTYNAYTYSSQSNRFRVYIEFDNLFDHKYQQLSFYLSDDQDQK